MEDRKHDRDWAQQGILIPRTLREVFRAESSSKTFGVKRLGTAGIALFLGLPDHIQDALIRWVDITAHDHPDDITPENAWKVFQAAVSSGPIEESPSQWFVDRIMDPEITLPPGQKPSDRARAEERRRRKAE